MSQIVWIPGWSATPSVFAHAWEVLPEYTHISCDFSACDQKEKFLAVGRHTVCAQPLPVDVIGWSMGAMIALQIAREVPESVNRLILISGSSRFLRNSDQPDGISSGLLDQMIVALERDPLRVVAAFCQRMFTHDERAAGFSRDWEYAYGRVQPALPTLRAGLEYLRDFAVTSDQIFTETHILHGSDDPICPASVALKMGEIVKTKSLTVWPGVGHAPFFTCKEQFNDWLRRIFRE